MGAAGGTAESGARLSGAMKTDAVELELTETVQQLSAVTGGLAVARGWRPEVLRVRGTEPLTALDRIVTQAVKQLRPGEGGLALLLHAKGQFRAVFAVLADGEGATLLAPPGRGGEVLAGLERYLALSRCRLERSSPPALTLLGPGWEVIVASCGADPAPLRAGGWAAVGEGEGRLEFFGWTLLGLPGVVVTAEGVLAAETLERRLAVQGAVPIGQPALECARILAGWPAWGAELTEATLPPEVAVLDELAISYRKGCYTGQETIARMKTYGHPNWRLVRLRQEAGAETAPALPCELFLEQGGKAKGRLTSWARHPQLGGVALGMVHRTVPQDAPLLSADGRRFVPLP